jgi:hypothetical protein
MFFNTHLRRAQFSKSYAILPVGGAIRGHTIYRQHCLALGRFCNGTWAFLNQARGLPMGWSGPKIQGSYAGLWYASAATPTRTSMLPWSNPASSKSSDFPPSRANPTRLGIRGPGARYSGPATLPPASARCDAVSPTAQNCDSRRCHRRYCLRLPTMCQDLSYEL